MLPRICLEAASENNVPTSADTYWFLLDGSRLLFYSAMLIYLYFAKCPRWWNTVYCSIQLAIYTMSTVADVLLALHSTGVT